MKKNKRDYFFEDIPVLGKLPPKERALKFEEAGEIRMTRKGLWPGKKERPCEHSAHTFGFVHEFDPGKNEFIEIEHAGNIKPDNSLKKSRIKITLGALRVADYPGSGWHQILFDFYAKNQLPGQVEPVHFNQTYRVMEGESAGLIGYPGRW